MPGRPTARSTRPTSIRDHYPLLHDVTATIGDPQVRNWGTIGGSVAHADPASDWPAVLIAANASIVCRGLAGDPHQMRVGENPAAAGERPRAVLEARGFFLDTFTDRDRAVEVLTEIRIPRRPRSTGGAYEKLERKVGDFATVGVAAIVRLGADGHIESAGIGLTGVADDAVRRHRRRSRPRRQRPIRRAVPPGRRGRRARRASPVGDVRGPVEYKRAMAAELTLRALRRATERALAYA